jgi:uncharacterized membrane protein
VTAPLDTPPDAPQRDRSRLLLAAFLLGAGAMHFVNPRFFDELIPSWLPGSDRFWTSVSGMGELAAGMLVLNRSTSKVGAWAAVVVLIVVFPANIWDAVEHPPTDARGIGSLLRLPMQVPMVLWAHSHTKR